MKPIIKVDRVCSQEEAICLQELGVDIINFCLMPDYRFNDSRYVCESAFKEMSSFLQNSRLCCTLESADISLDLIRDYQLDFIQCPHYISLNSQFIETVKTAGIGIIYSEIRADHDDYPEWIIHFSEEKFIISNYLFHVDVLPDVDDSWNFLQQTSPQYEDIVHIEDLNEIGNEFPILISIDFQPSNIKNILEYLPNIYGISFLLGENPTRDDFHWISYPDLIKILKIINYSE